MDSNNNNVYRKAIENTSNVGNFTLLTNKYCLVGKGASADNLYEFYVEKLSNVMPVLQCSLGGGLNAIGTLGCGNSNGLVVPYSTTDQELQYLRNMLPDEINVQRVEDKYTCLGNCLCVNDHYGIAHPQLDNETVEIIEDVLGISLYKTTVANEALVGTFAIITNKGGLVHRSCSNRKLEELASLLCVPLHKGTVAFGTTSVRCALAVNDFFACAGFETTAPELAVIIKAFGLESELDADQDELRNAIIEKLMEYDG
ncbi:hypothetical protein PCE1_005023 [Barthelona sp. PCE]